MARGVMQTFEKITEFSAKLLSIVVLVVQASILNAYFFKLDYSGASPYMWIFFDAVVLVWWLLSLLIPTCMKAESTQNQNWIQRLLNEFRYAYLSWMVYSIVLCFKINHMFFYFAERLIANPSLYSSTTLKIVISMAGIAFLLLVYCHHLEIKEHNYKAIMEKISLSACLDILDCLALLNILFVNDDQFELPYRLDRTIRAFSCICILLPLFPLLVLRMLQGPRSSKKWYSLSLITQTGMYFLFVNVPLFSIRLHLWIVHEIDISTFFTKNVIMLFKGAFDIIKALVEWYVKNKATNDNGQHDGDEDENGHMMEGTADHENEQQQGAETEM